MSTKLKLKTIKLETADGKTVELALAEAKDLHDQLHELFGTKYVPQAPIVIERDRYPWPYTPRWIENAPKLPTQPWVVYCTARHGSGLAVSMCGDAV